MKTTKTIQLILILFVILSLSSFIQSKTLDCVVLENDVSSNILASYDEHDGILHNDILVLKCNKDVFPLFKKDDKIKIKKLRKVKDFKRLEGC